MTIRVLLAVPITGVILAAIFFGLPDVTASTLLSAVLSGLILQGLKKPADCPAFGLRCTPEHPLGATMVSSEGACAAYYAYGRHLEANGTGPGGRSREPLPLAQVGGGR